MYGHNTNNQAGMSFNIMGANKPKKLEQLTHPNIKKFKSDFTNYHHETNGQATLQGHISDKVVAVIDSLLGGEGGVSLLTLPRGGGNFVFVGRTKGIATLA